MIKTIAYNELNLSTDIIYKKELLLEELREAKKNGINLNYAIKDYSELVPAEKWIREKHTDNDFMNLLFAENILDSPFEWKIDKILGTVTENSLYGGYWYRDNAKFYRKEIAQGMYDLAKKLKEEHISVSKYIYQDYQSETHIIDSHPIYFLASLFNQAETYEAIFKADPDLIALWKNNDQPLLSDRNILVVQSNNYYKIDSSIATIFYNLGIMKDYFADDSKKLHGLLTSAIYNNDMHFMEKYISSWDIPTIEKSKEIHESFLKSSRSNEMTELLLKNEAFVLGEFNGQDSNIFYYNYLHNAEKFKTIVESKPQYIEYIKTHTDRLFESYFSRHQNKEIIELLVKKYDFPVQNFDMLHVGKTIDKYNGISWALNLGADPRNCKNYIAKCIREREYGLSELKALHKEKILDVFYPDPLFHNLDLLETKNFITWLEKKATSENLSRYTIKGYPAWWGAKSLDTFNIVKPHIDITQKSTSNQSWLFYLVQHQPDLKFSDDGVKHSLTEKEKEKGLVLNDLKYERTMIKTAFKMQNKSSPNSFLDISGATNNNDNIFHTLFTYKKHVREDIPSNFFEPFMQVITPDFAHYLTEKNNQNFTPIELALDMINQTRSYNVSNVFNILIDKLIENSQFQNFEKKTDEGSTILQKLQDYYINDYEKIKKIEAYYQKYRLEHGLSNKNTTIVKKNKI